MTPRHPVCTLLCFLALAAPARADVLKDDAKFPSGGKDVKVERFQPKGKGPFPAVVLLNGSNGVEAHAKEYRGYGEKLAEDGYVALLVHYFDRTGTTYADRQTINDNFLTWMATVGDAVAYAGGLPNVNKNKVGLLGFSLGSYLALSTAAALGKDRVAAVAEYVGGLPDSPLNNLKKMPPTLVLHGDKDDIVPVQEAHNLEALLKKNDVPYEIKIYAGQKHVFTGDDAKDATERVFKFFGKYLKN